ncbi:hypothetical protein [Bacillus massilinigeriensis]|uniref:hypothetical protein n=1 Tax=Bacillus mediterraneensis TaxID=1805474 RepID=UPI0008F8792D|nr:hypothetical protein [Bacillus mediterraneensis]
MDTFIVPGGAACLYALFDWGLTVQAYIEEKEQIIQLTREELESSTDVPVKRSNKEYVLLLDIFFADESKQTEKIKVAIAGLIMADIKKN